MRVAELAFEFRQEFNKDVVIDLVCYRRRGHNEGDDPSMTQPLMYNLIEAKRIGPQALHRGAHRPRRHHASRRPRRRCATTSSSSSGSSSRPRRPQGRRPTPASDRRRHRPAAASSGRPRRRADRPTPPRRRADRRHGRGARSTSATRSSTPPEGFTVHPKLQQLLEQRAAMTRDGGIDWAMGELLAFGSLLMEGTPVRLAGQDSRRGTFVQRHAVLIDKETAEEWTPLLYLGDDQARFWVYDSLLSEFAAMGFEYGYSVERPDALVLWEAQFGDFANGAQTIIDEFISSLRAEVGPALLGRAAAAARLRGPGPRPLLRADRALPADVRRGQHDGGLPVDARRRTSTCCAVRPTPGRAARSSSSPRSRCCGSRPRPAASRTSPTGSFRPVLPDPRVARRRPRSTRVLLAAGKVVLRPARPSATKRERRRTPRSCGSSSWPAAGRRDRRRARRRTRTPSWSGCRTSRPTRARGRSWRSTCRRHWPSTASAAACGRRAPGVGLAGDRVAQDARAQQADLIAQAFDR